MAGLKTFLREMVINWDEPTFDALYERQRALVRYGLLPVVGGRGPGSGVPLNGDTVATFLIGLLVTDNLKDVGRLTEQMCAAKPLLISSKSTSRTKGRTFHADLSRALVGSKITGFQLGDDLNDNLYAGVQVTRHWRGVLLQTREIEHNAKERVDGLQGVDYIVSEAERLNSPMISSTASIEMEPWWMICLRLREAMKLEKERGNA